MSLQIWLGIGSIFIGFALFTASFVCFMYHKPPKLTWSLMALAFVFLTFVPVTIAVGWATLYN